MGSFYNCFMTLRQRRQMDLKTSSVSFQKSIVEVSQTDKLMPHIVASPLTFHSKPVTAMPPAAPVPARPINKPEPSELAKRDAPICSRSVSGLAFYWHIKKKKKKKHFSYRNYE